MLNPRKSKEILNKLRTKGLCAYFITIFISQDKFDLYQAIEEATEILSQRPYDEILDERSMIQGWLRNAAKGENYEFIKKCDDMLKYYDARVLGLDRLLFANH